MVCSKIKKLHFVFRIGFEFQTQCGFSFGRITGYTCPEGAVSYTYDANGNVLTVTDSNGTITRTYDSLNRVTSYTDTYGKVIGYEYDAVGNLSKIIYPDNTAVTYAYDANRNLVRVTDWANRVTSYTYDANNRVIGVVKPDGSITTTVYDSKQRVTSTVERTVSGAVITGFEYTYDDLSRIVEEKYLANGTKMCYTYDSLSRVTARTIKKLSDNSIVSTETFSYDAAGNITDAPDSCLQYDTNNRLIVFNGNSVSYDMDGNMLNNGVQSFTYDSANRLITAGGHTYTYDAADIRIRNLCADEDTTYTYDPHAKLSRLLCKTTNGVVTKYVYGRGLIGEETSNAFKTYHFDCRGSTIAITDVSGNITDTFAYDTYGKLISRTGTSKVIFGYNGRDGVVTDDNGLIYMRARYYSPEMKRFINADIIAGAISNAITLNRYAYANGNPVSFIDPFGLSVWSWLKDKYNAAKDWVADTYNNAKDAVVDTYNAAKDIVVETYNDAKQVVVDTYNEVKDWAVDTYNDVKERVVNTYNDAKDFVVDKYNDTKDWVDEKIVQPVATVVNNVKEDIQNYDKNNTDAEKVYKSHYFSSYKGTTIIRHSSDFLTSWGIGNMIFLNHNEDPPAGSSIGSSQISTLNHEYGHTRQCDELGLGKYILFVAIPSMAYNLASRDNKTLNDNYYNMPWEYDADLRGGVTRNNVASWAPTIRDIYFDLIN